MNRRHFIALNTLAGGATVLGAHRLLAAMDKLTPTKRITISGVNSNFE